MLTRLRLWPGIIYHMSASFGFTLTGFVFHLLTERQDISERWDRERGRWSSPWIELFLPGRTSNRTTSISQVKHRWLGRACRPSARRTQKHSGVRRTHTWQTYWHTDQEIQLDCSRANRTVAPTQALAATGAPMSNLAPFIPLITHMVQLILIYEGSLTGICLLFYRIKATMTVCLGHFGMELCAGCVWLSCNKLRLTISPSSLRVGSRLIHLEWRYINRFTLLASVKKNSKCRIESVNNG